MKHIVFISWWWPYPTSNGSKIRVYNLLRYLSQHYEVTLLSFAEEGEATPDALEHMHSICAHVEVVPKPIYNPTTRKALMGYWSRWPRSLEDVYSPRMAERLRQLARQVRIDTVIASQLQTVRYLDELPQTPAVMEEAEVAQFHDQVAGAAGRGAQFRARLTLAKLENLFRSLLRRGVAFTVVSETEQRYIQRIAPANAPIAVVQNGVDTAANQPDGTVQPKPNTLIYTGAVTYSANWDAVEYFVRDIFPLIRQRIPDVDFAVTGNTSSIDISQLASQPGVTFRGYLPSVASAVQESWALVVPLRQGGGTRLKILEAMALGTPVISTRKGAEGILVSPEEDILLADTPQEIADAVIRLLGDSALRAKLARNARALVEREYDWNVVAGRLVDVIEQVTTRVENG